LKFRGFQPDFNLIWRVIKVGVPASITAMERTFGQLVMTGFVIPFGTLAVAAHTLTQQVDQFINITGSGVGQATGILAGQNLGAGKPDKAEKSGWLGIIIFTSLMAVSSVALWFWGENIIGIFTKDPGVIAIGVIFVRIQIITYLFLGCSGVLQQCLNGVGDTITTMIVVLISMFALQVPLAYLLSNHTSLGVYGTRWAIAIGTVFMAVIYSAYFRIGRWKRRKI
jgi:Na+-driven multidrug efflux pump